MATKKKIKYQGKDYDVESSYQFSGRTYYRVKGIIYPISERLLDKPESPE